MARHDPSRCPAKSWQYLRRLSLLLIYLVLVQNLCNALISRQTPGNLFNIPVPAIIHASLMQYKPV